MSRKRYKPHYFYFCVALNTCIVLWNFLSAMKDIVHGAVGFVAILHLIVIAPIAYLMYRYYRNHRFRIRDDAARDFEDHIRQGEA